MAINSAIASPPAGMALKPQVPQPVVTRNPSTPVAPMIGEKSAEMSQIPDIGRIAKGMLADLVVVDGDPLKRIGVLTEPERIALVMKGGAIAKSTLEATRRTGSR